MLKIVIPANMERTTFEHFRRANRTLIFDEGVDLGRIAETDDLVVQLRSYDIPVEVEDTCDVGLCGSDWVEEKKMEFGVDLVVLSEYLYGRDFVQPPRLELVTRKDNPVSSLDELKPGSIIVTEVPLLTRRFLIQHNLKNVVILGGNEGVPKLPDGFRKWCEREGAVGLRTVHGREGGLINIGSDYGVMVNETGTKLERNQLKVIETIQEIKTQLIADRDAFRIKEEEISSLHQDLDRAYLTIYGESEASFRAFKERGN